MSFFAAKIPRRGSYQDLQSLRQYLLPHIRLSHPLKQLLIVYCVDSYLLSVFWNDTQYIVIFGPCYWVDLVCYLVFDNWKLLYFSYHTDCIFCSRMLLLV